VISAFARRYLGLMTKVDQLMPMLETLAIDEVIEFAQLSLQKSLVKKSVRQVTGAARNLLAGLRKRLNAIQRKTLLKQLPATAQRTRLGRVHLTHSRVWRPKIAKQYRHRPARQLTRQGMATPLPNRPGRPGSFPPNVCVGLPRRSAFVVGCLTADERRDVVGDADWVLVMRRMSGLGKGEQLQRR
jgi:hypothetical protein